MFIGFKENKTTFDQMSFMYSTELLHSAVSKSQLSKYNRPREQMYNDNESGSEAFTQDGWAICCYVFLVSLLCEGINVSNGVLMVSKPEQGYSNSVFN